MHLYIHNKSYKLRALFLPTGFFPLNKSGVSTTFFFSNALYITAARASSSAARVLKTTKKSITAYTSTNAFAGTLRNRQGGMIREDQTGT